KIPPTRGGNIPAVPPLAVAALPSGPPFVFLHAAFGWPTEDALATSARARYRVPNPARAYSARRRAFGPAAPGRVRRRRGPRACTTPESLDRRGGAYWSPSTRSRVLLPLTISWAGEERQRHRGSNCDVFDILGPL